MWHFITVALSSELSLNLNSASKGSYTVSLALAWELAVQWTARYPVFCFVSIGGNVTDQEGEKVARFVTSTHYS